MTSFTDIDEILQTPFLVKTVKIGMTIGNGIGAGPITGLKNIHPKS